jgi:hypothetical protein
MLLERKILEYGLDAETAAYVSAVFHAARFDATIAAWDGKYHYWGIRPFQYDPSFQPILTTPNFPGYPAGHTTVAGALARVLSHFSRTMQNSLKTWPKNVQNPALKVASISGPTMK